MTEPKPAYDVSKLSNLEAAFLVSWRLFGSLEPAFKEPECEYRFHPVRRWRFDFAWPTVQVAVEMEGGIWTRGRHTRGKGFEADCEKYNAATALGWRVFRCTAGMLEDDPYSFVTIVREAIEKKGAQDVREISACGEA